MDIQRIAKIEKVRRIRQEVYRKNPLIWLEERLGECRENLEWSKLDGYEHHKWDGDINPLARAWQVIADAYDNVSRGLDPDFKNIAIESATGCGKTHFIARLVTWFLDVFPNSLVVTSAPSETQLKLGLWSELSMLYPKIKKIRPNAQKWQLRLAINSSKETALTEEERLRQQQNSWHAVAFTTGVKADEESSNKARGFHRQYMLIILEECTGIPLPILTAFQNTCTGNMNFIFAVGNPDNEFDTLHQFASQTDCKNFRVSAFDYPNIVLNKEMYAGAVTHSSINSRTDNYGKGSSLWNAMVRGISPAQSTDSLIKIEWVEAIIDKEFEDGEAIDCYNAVGVDVANSPNGDKAALAWGRSNVLVEVQEFYCANATHLAYNLLMSNEELADNAYADYNTSKLKDYNIGAETVGVDAVGVGVATVNAFIDNGMTVQSLQGGCWDEVIPKEDIVQAGKTIKKSLYRFGTLRSQMYWELREDIRLGRISIKIVDKMLLTQIKKELTVPKYTTKGHYIEIEAKEHLKKRLGGKSPNVADAIVYWNWVRKGYRVNNVIDLPFFGG